MDPFSAEGELVNIHNAFHQGQFQSVVDFDTSSFSSENALPARILQLRSRIQLGDTSSVVNEIKDEASSSPDMAAVLAFAQHTQDPSDEQAKDKASELAESSSENLTVQLLCGTILANCGEEKEALALLAKHQGSLDAVAIIVQIHLAQNRLDLAQQEVKRARSWAQDNLLVNLAESWVGLREGGEKYQPAFYVYEELATAPATASPQNQLGQGIAELHLGRLPEAEAALTSALQSSPEDPDIIANAIVLNTLLGKRAEVDDLKAKLAKVDPEHVLLRDLEAKKGAFDSALERYNPKFEVSA